MRQLCSSGYKELSSDQCREVVDFVVAETRNYDERLDLRHLTKAYEDRRQWEHGHAETAWQDLVRTSLKKMLLGSPKPITKSQEIEEQRKKVKDALDRCPNDRNRQIEFTGLGKSTFYKRLRELVSA